MKIYLDYSVVRNDEDVKVEICADFYKGELEDYSVFPEIKLDLAEQCDIEERLYEAYAEEA